MSAVYFGPETPDEQRLYDQVLRKWEMRETLIGFALPIGIALLWGWEIEAILGTEIASGLGVILQIALIVGLRDRLSFPMAKRALRLSRMGKL